MDFVASTQKYDDLYMQQLDPFSPDSISDICCAGKNSLRLSWRGNWKKQSADKRRQDAEGFILNRPNICGIDFEKKISKYGFLLHSCDKELFFYEQFRIRW